MKKHQILSKNQKLAFVFIIILAIFLRVYKLDQNPIELFGDEVDAGYQAYSLMTTGRDYKGHFLPVYLQSFSEWRAPLLMYSMIPFIKIFGLNEWGVRLTSAFWGIISIVSFAYLLKTLKTHPLVILTTILFLSISPWHIQYSRAAFEVTLASTLIILGIIFIIKSFTNKGHLPLAGLFFGLSLYAYNTSNVISPLLIIASGLAYFWTGCESWKKVAKNALLALAITIVVALPLAPKFIWGPASNRFRLFSVIGHKSIIDKVTYYRNQSNAPFLAKIFYNQPVLWVNTVIDNYFGAFSFETLFGQGDVTFRHSLHEIGNLYWLELPLILLGSIWLISKRRRTPAEVLMLIWLLIAPIPASLTIDGKTHATRLFILIFPLSYLSGVGLYYLLNLAGKIKHLLTPTILLTFLAILFYFLRYQYFYWIHYPKQSWRWWHYGYKELIGEIKKQEANYSLVLIESTYEPALTRYLFWTGYNPRKIFNLDDSFKSKVILGFDGFCLTNDKVCFVNYGKDFKTENIQGKTLYAISQTRNVPGDWDWEKTPPPGIRIVKTIRSPDSQPIFYLITKLEPGEH
jgi:4-amino-4-deoxy-L-arabinose transferase-like glycosyltransferase